jgi:holo-[acyl-carrier protein] synthase
LNEFAGLGNPQEMSKVWGIGTDLVSVGRIERVMSRWGQRFLVKVLHPHERVRISQLANTDAAVRYLAGRWAAKEAIFKAFGQGRGNFLFSQMLVTNENTGRPNLVLEGEAKRLAEQLRVTRTHIAISHEAEYALAFALAETQDY